MPGLFAFSYFGHVPKLWRSSDTMPLAGWGLMFLVALNHMRLTACHDSLHFDHRAPQCPLPVTTTSAETLRTKDAKSRGRRSIQGVAVLNAHYNVAAVHVEAKHAYHFASGSKPLVYARTAPMCACVHSLACVAAMAVYVSPHTLWFSAREHTWLTTPSVVSATAAWHARHGVGNQSQTGVI